MKTSKVFGLCAVFIVLNSHNAQAFNLNFYRTERNIKDGEKVSLERTQRLRVYLGTAQNKFEALETKKNLFFPTIDSGIYHRLTSSLFIKTILEKAILAMKKDAEVDKPMTYKPSTWVNREEVDAVERKHKLLVCKKTIGDDMSRIVDYFAILASDSRHGTGTAEKTEVIRPEPAENAQARVKEIQNYLDLQMPRSADQKIAQILGTVSSAEVVDGYVTQVNFSAEKSFPLTLSSLVTFRTGEDDYFLQVLDCVGEFVSSSIEVYERQVAEAKSDKNKKSNSDATSLEKETLPMLKGVYGFASEKFLGAIQVHERLVRLSTPQVNFLLDLFLQMNATDIPAETEIEGLKSYLVQMAQDGKSNLVDFQYYTTEHEQLSRLDDKLRDERNRAEKQAQKTQERSKP